MNDAPSKLVRFADLKAAGIVTNWPQLGRLQKSAGFPTGFLLSPGCRVWEQEEITAWVNSRKARSENRQQVAA